MIRIGVQQDIDRVIGDLSRQFPRQVEIAQQRAVLGTARDVKTEVVNEMRRVFDRPTPWTLNAFTVRLQDGRIRPAAGGEISARVEVKDGYWYRADNYLQTQIEGASNRKQKAFERALQRVRVLPVGWLAVPGQRAKLDAYGNHSAGEIRQILSWFDAAELVLGSTQNMRDAGRNKRRKGTRRSLGWEYFAVQPGARRGGLHPGIYRRTFRALGGQIEPIVIFIQSASYRKRFDFEGVGRRTVERVFKPRLQRALDDTLSRIQP